MKRLMLFSLLFVGASQATITDQAKSFGYTVKDNVSNVASSVVNGVSYVTQASARNVSAAASSVYNTSCNAVDRTINAMPVISVNTKLKVANAFESYKPFTMAVVASVVAFGGYKAYQAITKKA